MILQRFVPITKLNFILCFYQSGFFLLVYLSSKTVVKHSGDLAELKTVVKHSGDLAEVITVVKHSGDLTELITVVTHNCGQAEIW